MSKVYNINIISIDGNQHDIGSYDGKYENVLNKYRKEVERLKNYKIINKIELTEGYKHNNTYKLLEETILNDEIKIENLSQKYGLKLLELFMCLAYGNNYFKDGECDYNAETHQYEINRKEEFWENYNLANEELEYLLKENIQQVVIEDSIYDKIKGTYKCIISDFTSCENNILFAEATVTSRIEKLKCSYKNKMFDVKIVYSTNSKIIEQCKSHNYDALAHNMKENSNMPCYTGTGNDTVTILTDNEYMDLMNECKEIEDKIKEENRLLEEKREIERKKREIKRQIWKDAFSIVKQKSLVYPRGGEDGVDGYYQVVVENNETEERFEVVLRNVFDAGCWTNIVGKNNEDKRSESEKLACKWVYDHSPFSTGMRM